MGIINKCLCCLLLAGGYAWAQDSLPHPSAVYINPARLIIGSAAAPAMLVLFVNYERIYRPGRSIIVTPAFIIGDGGGALGLSAGPRKYLNGTSAGAYLQAKGHVYFDSDGNGLAQVVGYVGYKKEFDRIAIFIDAGLGYAFLLGNDPDRSLGGDFNFAIGYTL